MATNCPGPAEVEVLDVEAGDLGPPTPRGEGQQHDCPVADRERRLWRPLQLDGSGEPLRSDGGAAMIAAGVFAPSPLEQIADHALVGRRYQAGGAVKEPDRRGPRAEGLGLGAAVAQVAKEGRDEGRMRPQPVSYTRRVFSEFALAMHLRASPDAFLQRLS